MKLPNVAAAEVPDEKVRDYLLSSSHPVGRFKARFFRALGFELERWEELAAALVDHAERGEATPARPGKHGQKYEVRAMLVGPGGKMAAVLAVWIVPEAGTIPRLVTAFPDRK